MQIINDVRNLNLNFPGIVIALGTFDGIHIGHQKIIARAVALAKEINGTSVVFTFSNHPLSVVSPQHCPLQLVTKEYKAELIATLGVDILLSIPFTPEFLQLTAAQFIQLAVGNLSPKHIVVGPNYFFGHKRSGTPELLQNAGEKHNFKVEIHPTVYCNDNMISSTAIRQLIARGSVDKVPPLLGRLFEIEGVVIHGAKRGRELGYPTINLELAPHLILPADGVYAVSVTINKVLYHGIANIGNNPTFHEIHRRLEVHILNFSGDLYGQSVTVSFLKHIRGQLTFANATELKMKIGQDIEMAQPYYSVIPLK
jgi:riboflavin kinase/FMN adenylyltransferase